MNSLLMVRNALAIVIVLMSSHVSAMSYAITGEVLTLAGAVSAQDAPDLKAALARGIKYVVLKGPTGSDYQDATFAARAIQDAKVTTVVQGYCGYACARLFLAGERRMYSGDVYIGTNFVELSARGFYFDFSKTSDDSQNLKAVVDFPWGVWIEYAFPNTGAGNFTVGAILVFHPDAKISNGVVGCSPSAKKRADCTELPKLNALGTKVITTVELFRMPVAPAASQNSAPL